MSLASGYKEIPYRNLNQKGTLGIDGNTTNLLNRIFYQLFNKVEQNYEIYNKELLAIIQALKQW